jgi:glycosyltransferase involved in cell wall biosynthesis
MTREKHILWFRPDKWENVSVRRERITEKLESRGVNIDLTGATLQNFTRYWLKAAKGEYDVIIGNVRLGLYGGYLVARASHTPFIGDVSDPLENIDHLPKPLYLALGQYEKFVLRHTDGNVFLPETIKGMEKYGIDGEIAGNAVDFELFSDPNIEVIKEAGEILRGESVSLDDPIAIYLGSMPEQRHFEEIIEAARITEDWQFVIVGEGPMEEMVTNAAEEIDNLFFPGSFDYELMPGFLHHANAGFCLEHVERPLKISEYGAAGLPTLGAHGKLEEEFSEDELYFIEPESGEISAVLRRIREDPNGAEERTRKLREHARQYSWEEVASTYYQMIKSISDNQYAD